VIRRIIWLGLGAVLGVTGYRRITKLARALEPRAAAVTSSKRAAGAVAFMRDVRTGMAEYLDAHDEY
jgi:hypothetical protein